jgi:hypothetical protein
MTAVHVTDTTVTIRQSRLEKLAGLYDDLEVPRSAIRSVEVLDDGIRAVTGIRAPGLGLPTIKLGTWRGRSGPHYVAVRRGQPALRLELEGERHRTVLVSTTQAEQLARQLRR